LCHHSSRDFLYTGNYTGNSQSILFNITLSEVDKFSLSTDHASRSEIPRQFNRLFQ